MPPQGSDGPSPSQITTTPAEADAVAAIMAAQGGGGGSSSIDSGPVYWGTTRSVTPTGHVRDSDFGPGGTFLHGGLDQTKTQEEAMYWLLNEANQNSADYRRIRDELIAAGQVKPSDGVGAVLAAYQKYLSLAAINLANPKAAKKMTPEDYIRMDARLNGTGGPTTQHYTTTSVSHMGAAEVEARAQDVTKSALGRRLSAKEAAAYTGTARGVESANPQVTSTTSTTNAAGTSQTNRTTSSGGVSAAAIDEALLHQAMQNPEYGAYQAAGFYFPILLSALGAVTGAGASG